MGSTISGNGGTNKFWNRQLPLETETCFFVLVNALDVFMTFILLYVGNFSESNTLANYFLSRWGVRGMVYYKFVLVGVIVTVTQIIAKNRPGIARRILNWGTAIVLGVVIYSCYLFVRHSGFVL
jgi:hypothetical protein